MDSVFDHLYQKYHQDLFRFLFYMVKNKELAEDLVQEVYIRVLKAYDRFEGNSSEKTWLFSIAKNVAIDHFRKQKGWKKWLLEKLDFSATQISDQLPLPEELAQQKEEIKLIYHCLDRCTVDQKMVIILRYIHELSIGETAEALDWTESKVKTTQHRAIKSLRKMMEEVDKEVVPSEKTEVK
ncbi:RNA polymerase, sigma subunit, SigX [Mesobacillus persicus]|uniref:RNA polymerase sigma factor n=1 Tax=Mesobacillus persicus TaxID=930146 RepID=A0A1H8BU13_9BACI|nr:RNA polymerase sigma factor SigX [Mesobacillus persicus]SEM86273.1 RNA polymerase, sigma subunit, SigX [Mesobacillus persicus]